MKQCIIFILKAFCLLADRLAWWLPFYPFVFLKSFISGLHLGPPLTADISNQHLVSWFHLVENIHFKMRHPQRHRELETASIWISNHGLDIMALFRKTTAAALFWTPLVPETRSSATSHNLLWKKKSVPKLLRGQRGNPQRSSMSRVSNED